MAYKKETKDKAKELYIKERLALCTIAISLNIPAPTIRRWKSYAKRNGDDWDIQRSAYVISDDSFENTVSEVIENFVMLFQASMDNLKNDADVSAEKRVRLMASLTDAFQKMVSASKKVSPELNRLGIAMDVLIKLSEYIHKNHPNQSEAFLEVLEPFGEEFKQSI